MYPIILSSSSDLPTWEAATMTIFLTFGSVNAFIGSARYGVLLVLHGPASAEFSGERRRYLSAHSSTVRFSGGLKCATSGAIAALRAAAAFLVVLLIGDHLAPAFSVAHALRVGVRVVLILRELLQDRVTFAPDYLGALWRRVHVCHIHGQAAG